MYVRISSFYLDDVRRKRQFNFHRLLARFEETYEFQECSSEKLVKLESEKKGKLALKVNIPWEEY